MEVKRWFEITIIMAQGQLEKTMYKKTHQLPIFNFIRELLAVINGSYREHKKWMGKFYSNT